MFLRPEVLVVAGPMFISNRLRAVDLAPDFTEDAHPLVRQHSVNRHPQLTLNEFIYVD